MIWTITTIVVLAISITLLVIACIKNISVLGIISLIVFFISGLVAIMIGIALITAHCMTNRKITSYQMQHDSIIREIEALENSESEKLFKVEVIRDVYEWNSDVCSKKYWSVNPWTNWFYNKEVVDSLEYIEMEE